MYSMLKVLTYTPTHFETSIPFVLYQLCIFMSIVCTYVCMYVQYTYMCKHNMRIIFCLQKLRWEQYIDWEKRNPMQYTDITRLTKRGESFSY